MPFLSQIKYALGMNKQNTSDFGSVIIDAVAHGLVVINPESKVTFLNPAAEKILDVTATAALGKNWFDVMTPLQDNQEIPFEMRPEIRTLKTGMPTVRNYEDNMSFQVVKGRKFPVSVAVNPLMNDGFVTGAVITFHDLTEEKAYRDASNHQLQMRTQELKELEFIFESSINSLNVGYIMVDENHAITFLNGNAKRVLFNRMNPDENMLVSNPALLTKKFTLEEIQENVKDSFDFIGNIDRCIKEQKPIEARGVAFGKRFLHAFFSPIVILRNKLEIVGCVILLEDITSAIVLERSKDDFLSMASHELRTPLTAIRGNTSLLKRYYGEKVNDPDFTDMIHDIHHASVNLIAVVRDFLDTSRLEQGKIEFKKEDVKLPDLIQQVIIELQELADKKQLSLKLENVSEAVPVVQGDKEKVRQVLENLIGNSIKFTQTGGVTVKLEVKGEYVIVSVIDTGQGIPSDNQKMLFNKFQQVGNSVLTRDASKGSGLGLYICKMMMEGMGGAIYLEKSEAGQGSTFVFSLPINKTP